MNRERFSHFYQLTDYSTTHDTTHATKCRNEKTKHFNEALDHLSIVFPKLSFCIYFEWIYTACAYKNYAVTWNGTSGGKCGRLSEEYPKCWRITTNWGNGIYGLGCNANFFNTFFIFFFRRFILYRKTIFCNLFHCRYKELIFITYYFALRISFYISYFWKQSPEIIPWNRCSPKLSKIL